MTSRKSRLSLSKDIHKDVKTPNGRRTSTHTPVGRKNSESQKHDESCEVSPSQSGDYSPIVLLTQDTSFHAINGVSWEWNSPQRMQDQSKNKSSVTKVSKQIAPHKLKYSVAASTAPKQPTGFNKFISKLNMLMGKENMGEDLNTLETSNFLGESSCVPEDLFIVDHAKQCQETSNNVDSDDDLFQEHMIDSPNERCTDFGTELDDSKLDHLLIEASQTVEQKLTRPVPAPPALISNKSETNLDIPIEMNDSDMDGFLVRASLMVEEKLSNSSQESTSNKPNQPEADTMKAIQTTISRSPTTNGPQVPCHEDNTDIKMSNEDLKALIEKKRQEALRRLQNNRLKRGMKGTNSHG